MADENGATAHNGLVGGSSPPGPTKFAVFCDVRKQVFAFNSRQSLANRWPSANLRSTTVGARAQKREQFGHVVGSMFALIR